MSISLSLCNDACDLDILAYEPPCFKPITSSKIATIFVPCGSTDTDALLATLNPKTATVSAINTALQLLLVVPASVIVLPTKVGAFENLAAQEPQDGMVVSALGETDPFYAPVKNRKFLIHKGAQLAAPAYHEVGYTTDKITQDLDRLGRLACVGEFFDNEDGTTCLRWWVTKKKNSVGSFPPLTVSASTHEEGETSAKVYYKGQINVSQAEEGGLTYSGVIILDSTTITALKLFL